MKRVTLILVMLLCANAASGQTVWLEDGDAPAILPAQPTIGPAALTEIKGSLGGNTDVDLYVIYIDDEAIFSASTIGGASFDTALYLLDPDGYGIAMSDDAGGGSQSAISSTFVTANGTYILAVTGADRDPVDWLDAELWLDTPKDTERAPDGAGAAGYLDDWIDSGAFGAYSVFLTGARCATVAAMPTGACCSTVDGSCQDITGGECVALPDTSYHGNGTICQAGECPQLGACCLSGGICQYIMLTACTSAGGTFLGELVPCDPNPCPQPGACCIGYQTTPQCVITPDEATCYSSYVGTWQGPGTTCETVTCPMGACCWPSTGNCYIRSEYFCGLSGFEWQGPDTVCDPNPCPQPTGACCVGDNCVEVTEEDCLAQGGTYIYDWEPCVPDMCKTGACCFASGGCFELVNWYCTSYAVLGTFMGPDTTCYPSPCGAFTPDWADNFDSYGDGTLLYHVGGWTGWDDLEIAAGTVSSTQAYSAPHSIVVNDTADAIHPFSPPKEGGQWVITAWQYIPSGLSSRTYFIVNSYYEHGGPYFAMIQMRFDPITGKVWDDLRTEDDPFGGWPACLTGLPIAYDQWAEIRIEVDFAYGSSSMGHVKEYYNDQLLCEGSWIAGSVGQLYIANIDLYAPHSTPVYYDDLSVAPAGAAPQPTVPLFVGKEGTTTTPTRTTDLSGFPDVTWNDGFQGVRIGGAAGRPDGYMYLADAYSSGRYLYIAPFQGPAIELCRGASGYYYSSLAYGRGKLYGYRNTSTLGIYEIDTTTCVATLKLATSPYRYFALDYNRADGLLYGYTEYGTPTGLYKIDLNVDPPTQTFVAGNIPGSNSAGRGLAVGDNKVYVVPSNQYPNMYVYDLAQGIGGTWQAMTGPFSTANPGGTGAAWVTLPKPGDLNCDGLVDGQDIQGFVLALVDPAAYSGTAPGWDCTLLNADVNLDGARNELDIAPFVQVLIGE